MRNYALETEKRVAWIREQIGAAGADGVIFNNSGGKDCALVGILCKMACEDTVGLILPCEAKRNFGEDADDANALAEKFGISMRTFDLTAVKAGFVDMLSPSVELNKMATTNLAPRLRMLTLYAVANAENRLAAGTGNRSETFMGYFTKWGDGAYDFNPIADLTVTEVYEFLRYLGAPESIITKPPSAGLFEGQTDELEMGITYAAIDDYILNGVASDEDRKKLDAYHSRSEHKRRMPSRYGFEEIL